MIVLGLDPGLALTGYGIVEEKGGQMTLLEAGCFRTLASHPVPERLQTIFSECGAVLSRHTVCASAVEKLFFNTNVSTAMAVAEARGVIMLALANHNIPIAEYTPLQVKQSLTGFGRADKVQIQRMVQSLLRLDQIVRPDDAADAVAIALCHIHSHRFASALRKGGDRLV